jgi:hypothetical protein
MMQHVVVAQSTIVYTFLLKMVYFNMLKGLQWVIIMSLGKPLVNFFKWWLYWLHNYVFITIGTMSLEIVLQQLLIVFWPTEVEEVAI